MFENSEVVNELKLRVLLQGKNDIARSGLYHIQLPLEGDDDNATWASCEPAVDPALHGDYVEFPKINSRFNGIKHRCAANRICLRCSVLILLSI